MKIVFLTDFLPNPEMIGGGLQNQFAHLAQSFHEMGDEVLVICKSRNSNYTQYPFHVMEVKLSPKVEKYCQSFSKWTFHKIDYTLMQAFEAWAVARRCRQIPGVDIIQSSNYQFMSLFIKPDKARRIVFAASYRPLWSETKGVRNTFDNRLTSYLEGVLYKRAGAVFAPSAHLAAILEAQYKRPIDVLPTPLSENSLEENPGWYEQHLGKKKYMLYFGDMIKRKGIFTLAKAMQAVWEEDPDVLLVMAGPDKIVNGSSVMGEFIKMIEPHENKVIYAGEIDHPALFPLIKNAHFVILPSIEDNCPNTMLEAMSLGKAVIGTIGSSLDEFYPASCSDLLVPRQNSGALAEKILKLWNSPPEQLDGYGKQCKSYIEENHALNKATLALRNYYVQKISAH